MMTDRELMALAQDARKRAYAPYSHFTVGAALLTETGRVYTGCNIECASLGATNCAERTAVFKAVSEGERTFSAIAVVGGAEGEEPTRPCAPCGICRQVLGEFCPGDFRIVLMQGTETETYRLRDLLPLAFSKSELPEIRNENV